MASKASATRQIRQLLASFQRLPSATRGTVIAIAVIVGGVLLIIRCQSGKPLHQSASDRSDPENAQAEAGHGQTIVLCHWNMENLFDDKDDRRRHPDEEYDSWFVNDPEVRKMKYQRLTQALLRLNRGNGPDIIVGNEIESTRAAGLLMDSLNACLPQGAKKYDHIAMIELDAGRHLAPCVISRFSLVNANLLGKRQRTLEVHVVVNGHDLCLIASHWTSQLSDRGDDQTRGRFAYADTIHAAYVESVRRSPTVDFLVCGDFNDSPEADSVVNHLHMTGDISLVTTTSIPPRLFAPLSAKTAGEFGTHYYKRPLIYDHIGLSPGMLDDIGWSYISDSVAVPTAGLIRPGSHIRRPWRFGSSNDNAMGRGYSDHFPVLVTLRVAP